MAPTADLRRDLRTWLDDHVTDELRAADTGIADSSTLAVLRPWNAALADDGWAAPSWPVAFGGRDATIEEQVACFEEMSAADAPGPINVIGISNIAPAIMLFGTDEQKERFLRPMLRGDEIWSQGMSEPDAGSDLGGLRTSAVLDGDHFVVNGQKTWNSLGHLADWCQLYVRTDPTATKHRGISCLLVDLRTAGVEARPLITSTGEDSFAELFFSDVRVPKAALLGTLNEGWNVAMATLAHERAGVARLHLLLAKKLRRLLDDPSARAARRDPRVRQRLAAIHSEITCLRLMTARTLHPDGAFASGAGGSLVKLAWSRCEQALASLAVDALGSDGLDGWWAHNLVSMCQVSIAGGTTEINLNIVGEHVLGLPREPR